MFHSTKFRQAAAIMLFLALSLWYALALPSASAESYQFDSTPDPDWHIHCSLEAPEPFADELYQYKYRQQKAEPQNMGAQLSAALEKQLSLTVDECSKSHVFSGKSAMMLLIPDFVTTDTVPSEAQRRVMERFRQGLEDAGFHPDSKPYLCISLEDLMHRRNAKAMGLLQDWPTFAWGICSESSVEPAEDDLMVVYAAQINGYPILPALSGNFSDADVPMYGLMLVQQEQPGYVEIGCSYEIIKERRIDATPIDWKAAVDSAFQEAYKTWKPAFDARAISKEGFRDYEAFFTSYSPSFELSAHSVKLCYVAQDRVLSPAYQVNLVLQVHLAQDEGLSPEERHKYVPETLPITYVIHAMTGDIVS